METEEPGVETPEEGDAPSTDDPGAPETDAPEEGSFGSESESESE